MREADAERSGADDPGAESWDHGLGDRMRLHYERYPYPKYGLLGSVRARDAYVFDLRAIWAHFNGASLGDARGERILLAGSGSFLPYPVSLANPRARIVALDLSSASLARARLHALRHLRFNLDYVAGDLMDPSAAPGSFKYIDAYGVLHCIPDFPGALRALEARLSPGGILRVMVYSRDGRAEVEAVRKLCGERGITRPREVERLARENDMVRECMRDSFELGFAEGIADAFLIPYARIFVVDEVLEALSATGLELLRFGHRGALPDLERELARIRKLEARRAFPTNLTFYVGKGVRPPAERRWLLLNPTLRGLARLSPVGTLQLPAKFGQDNPPLDPAARRFLSRFARPVEAASLSGADRKLAKPYLERMILVGYS